MNVAAGTDGDLEKAFVVTTLSRLDIIKLGVTAEQAAMLTDDDMQAIADQMGLAYTEYGGFWADLSEAVRQKVEERGLTGFEISDEPVEDG